MDPRTVHQRGDDFQVLDVREDSEWLDGRIEGALHIPLGELPGRLGELDRSRPVVAVCRSGNRSGVAVEYLARAGFSAHNVDGGMRQWARAGLPVTTCEGEPDASPEHRTLAPISSRIPYGVGQENDDRDCHHRDGQPG